MKKISQNDLRLFMSAHKKKVLASVKRIESPLAKYLDDGVLTCIVCCSVVKSEAVWNVHINSKQHKNNIARKIQPPAPPTPPAINKRPILEVEENKPKKLKSILKNAPPVPIGFFDVVKTDPASNESIDIKTEPKESNSDDSFEEEQMEVEEIKDAELPEGFFDDPILDAKARNVEYKDPVQEEWEKFQKEIREEEELSAEIIHHDSEDATVQRRVEHIDEQMSRLSRVVQLQRKTEEVKAKLHYEQIEIKKENISSDEDDSDLDIEFDWRAKSYLS